jgi:hypothetical protein
MLKYQFDLQVAISCSLDHREEVMAGEIKDWVSAEHG